MRTEVVTGALTRELRRAVLRPGWPVGSAMHGDDDPQAVHLAAYDGAELVGAGLILPAPYPPRPDEPGGWQLRGMATEAARRGTGVGALVLAAAVAEAAGRGGRLIWCNARSVAVGFYARYGFTVDGPEFVQQESGLPHHRMWRPLHGA